MENLNARIDVTLKNGRLNAIYKKFHDSEPPPEMPG